MYESLRRYGAKEGVLVAWGTDTDGRKQLLHLAVGNKESEACWTEFLRDMVSRGLRVPTSVTADGAPGLLNADLEGVRVSGRQPSKCEPVRGRAARPAALGHRRGTRIGPVIGGDAVAGDGRAAVAAGRAPSHQRRFRPGLGLHAGGSPRHIRSRRSDYLCTLHAAWESTVHVLVPASLLQATFHN